MPCAKCCEILHRPGPRSCCVAPRLCPLHPRPPQSSLEAPQRPSNACDIHRSRYFGVKYRIDWSTGRWCAFKCRISDNSWCRRRSPGAAFLRNATRGPGTNLAPQLFCGDRLDSFRPDETYSQAGNMSNLSLRTGLRAVSNSNGASSRCRYFSTTPRHSEHHPTLHGFTTSRRPS